jgi:acyl-CoA synthetase (NDP forming)/RimJ/RimL family protein N-acetyltransferase
VTTGGTATRADAYSPRSVLLANGSRARIRASTTEDRAALLDLHRGASDTSIYLRFFSMNRSAGESFVDRVCTPSPTSWSLVAERAGRILGIATASVESPGSAEVALLVDEQLHGQGVGTVLLEQLAEWSWRRDVTTFVAEVLTANTAMLRVFHDAGFRFTEHRDHEVLSLTMDIRPSADSVAVADWRERTAERRSLAPLLEPASVCVVGVSRHRGGIGREVLENVLVGGYRGAVTAVGREGLDVPGVRCVSSLEQVPPHQDLAVVALPVDQLEQAVRDLGAQGTRSCVILTSGLGETSPEGRRCEERLAELARDCGMRVVGPNCFGVLSNLRDTRLNATFGRNGATPGVLAVGSQSGGVGVAVLEASRARGTGIACFVSLGNKLDVSGNDLLAAWADDPAVGAAALYLESFHDPRKFARVAAVFARQKPLLVAFGGTSTAGLRAGASHTAASATPTRALHAMFKTAGVVAVEGVEDLVDTAALLTEQPLPRGARLGILGNAGGLGILAADAAQRAGLAVPELSARTRGALSTAAPAAASTTNPVDLGAGAGPESYRAALDVLVSSGDVDAVLVQTASTAVTDVEKVGEAVAAVAARSDVPVLTVASGERIFPGASAGTGFGSAEAAVRALARASAYALWRRENTGDTGSQDAGPMAADGEPGGTAPARPGTRSTDEGWLAAADAAALLRDAGGRIPAMTTVHTVEDAAAAAARIGFPVVVKAAAGEIVHKSDARLVRTGLHDTRDVRAAAGDLLAALGNGAALLVQAQVSGPELAIGLTRDERFGPLVMVASGGVNLDLWEDQAFLMPPLRRSEIREALHSLRTWPLLDGFRGAQRVNVEPVVDLVEAVGRLGSDHPEILGMDLNPVVCTTSGPVCVDVKVRTAGAWHTGPSPRRT